VLVTTVKTHLVKAGDDISEVLIGSIKSLPEKSVLVIASKIFSLCENRIIKKVTGAKAEKQQLVKKEAEYYLDPQASKYDIMLTIKGNWMFANAGIDESNSENQYSLWPNDPQKSVNNVWNLLRRHFKINKLGVIMSDSKSFPLNWGVIGHGIAHCGFETLKSYIGKSDLFGRLMKMEQVNMVQGIAAAGVLEMGEGSEQTPIAMITDIKDIIFQDHQPTIKELQSLAINLENDVYAPLLTAVKWKTYK